MNPPPLRPPAAAALAAASGLLLLAALPRADAWPLAFVALTPLVVATHRQPPLRAAALGWIAGLATALPGIAWLHGTLVAFSGLAAGAAAAVVVAVAALQAARLALATAVAACAARRGWPRAPLLVAALVGVEVAIPLPFPWTMAATLHSIPELLQGAELGGPYLVVLLLAGVGGALAEPWVARLDQRPPRWAIVALGVSAPVVAFAAGCARIRALESALASAPLGSVGIVQANLGLLAKSRDREEGVRTHLALTRGLEAGAGPLDVVVWSETSVMLPIAEREAATELALRVGPFVQSPVVTGAVLVREAAPGERARLLNAAVLVGRDPTQVGTYAKRRLLPLGEYVPLERWVPWVRRWLPRTGRFVPGEATSPLRLGERGLAASICYEDVSPEVVRDGVRQGRVDLLVNLTNDAWFGDTAEPWLHLALAKLRAIEHRRYLIRATNSGVSAVVDPAGRVVASAPSFRPATLVAEIRWLSEGTVWGAVGPGPWWGLAVAAAAAAALRRPGSRRDPARSTPGDRDLPRE
ncbi:MAG: apolipoprotein N-acyltransferase [Polyangiaceae bacterium]|nr:apolipoprotein N-acyltransferase [Polyangiaceae bacterium]